MLKNYTFALHRSSFLMAHLTLVIASLWPQFATATNTTLPPFYSTSSTSDSIAGILNIGSRGSQYTLNETNVKFYTGARCDGTQQGGGTVQQSAGRSAFTFSGASTPVYISAANILSLCLASTNCTNNISSIQSINVEPRYDNAGIATPIFVSSPVCFAVTCNSTRGFIGSQSNSETLR